MTNEEIIQHTLNMVHYAGLVFDEIKKQDDKWGEQNHPDGTGSDVRIEMAIEAKGTTDRAAVEGDISWRHILDEEVAEAFAESDPGKLQNELIQVAAVALQWVMAIDRRDNG